MTSGQNYINETPVGDNALCPPRSTSTQKISFQKEIRICMEFVK